MGNFYCFNYFTFNESPNLNFIKLGSIFMLMRVLLTSLLIFGQSARSYDRATCFYLVNIAYCLYLIIVRQLENPQDNIIEIINQTLFCSMAVLLLWLNTKEAWTPFYEGLYTTIFMGSPTIGSFICLSFLIKSIVIRIKKWKVKNKQQNIAPKEPSCRNREPQRLNHHNPSPSPRLNNQSSSMSRSNVPIASHQASKNQPPKPSYSRRITLSSKLNNLR